MIRRTMALVILSSSAVATLTGCMPKMTIEDMKAMMPQRPAELDKLNAFAGRWEFSGEAKMAGLEDVLKTTGENEAKWEGNGWFLVSRGAFRMADFDDVQSMETWTYDTHDKKFRSTWVDSMGTLGTGTSWYDAKTDTWHMRAISHGPFGASSGKGTVKITGKDTMEWTWSEYALGGLIKTMEMSGTSKRR